MASFTGTTDNQYITPKIVWTEDQSISENYTDVTATLYYSRTNEGYTTYGTWKGSITINGTTTNGSERIEITYNSNTKAMSAKVRVYHESDGTKKITIKATGGISGTSLGSTNISSTVTLTTIPRSSSITSVSNVTLGDACNVKWTPASSSFKYKLKFKLGDWSHTTDYISPNTTSAYTYTDYSISLNAAKQITNTTTGTMTVYLYTYNGSTQIGSTESKTFTVTVPSSIIPKISYASIEIDNSANSTVAKWGLCIVGYSRVKVIVNEDDVSGSYGSTISSFTISGGYTATKTGTSLNYTGEIFKTSGEKSFNIVANDSRGRSSSSVNAGKITVYSYTKPKVTEFVVSRDEDDLSKIIVKADWTYDTVNGNNTATVTLKYKEVSSSEWTTYTGDITKGGSTLLSSSSTIFDEKTSYDFQLIITDSLSDGDKLEAFVSTMKVLLDFRAGGKGLGIGKVSESDAMEVGMDTTFFNPVTFEDKSTFEVQSILKQGSYVHIANGISGENGYINIARFTIRNSYINSPIVLHILQRGTNKSVYHIRFYNNSSLDPELQYFTYQGGKPAYLFKADEGIWDLYLLKSEKYDNVN